MLGESFSQLQEEMTKLIVFTDEMSKNYISLSENFGNFQHLKGNDAGKLHEIAKDISSAFQASASIKKEELVEQTRNLKEPIEDYKSMIGSALDACTRRRNLVMKYYELRLEIEKIRQILSNGVSS